MKQAHNTFAASNFSKHITMKKKLFTLIIAGLMGGSSLSMSAQEMKNDEPKGKAIVQGFMNFHSNFDSDNPDLGFELERAYLGYQYKMTNGLSIKAVMDIGSPKSVTDYERLAYIKNAMISWKTGKLTLNGGLISTTQFNFQEKAWGYRYIMKSFQDKYKFGSSADLGISASYRFADWISADAIIVNGEGYKKIQVDDGLNYGLGLTLSPLKGLNLRVYGGINQATEDGEKNIINCAFFLGYKTSRISLGAEYNIIQNAKFTDNSNFNGFSLFASGKVLKNMDIYARYDQLDSNDDLHTKDESAMILGLQLKLGKYVKLAPNFRMSIPKADGEDNSYAAYLSCYFGL